MTKIHTNHANRLWLFFSPFFFIAFFSLSTKYANGLRYHRAVVRIQNKQPIYIISSRYVHELMLMQLNKLLILRANRKVKCDLKSFEYTHTQSHSIGYKFASILVVGFIHYVHLYGSYICTHKNWLTTIEFCNFSLYIGNKHRKDKYLMNANANTRNL